MTVLCMRCLRDWTEDHVCAPVEPPSNLELVARHLVRREVIAQRAQARRSR